MVRAFASRALETAKVRVMIFLFDPACR